MLHMGLWWHTILDQTRFQCVDTLGPIWIGLELGLNWLNVTHWTNTDRLGHIRAKLAQCDSLGLTLIDWDTLEPN